MSKQRKRDWQDPYVQRAFDAVRQDREENIPPVVVDAMQRMATRIQDQIATENTRAVASPVRKKKRSERQEAGIAASVGAICGSVTEFVDFIFLQGFGHDRSIMELLDLSLVDGAITSLITGVVTWIVRRTKT